MRRKESYFYYSLIISLLSAQLLACIQGVVATENGSVSLNSDQSPHASSPEPVIPIGDSELTSTPTIDILTNTPQAFIPTLESTTIAQHPLQIVQVYIPRFTDKLPYNGIFNVLLQPWDNQTFVSQQDETFTQFIPALQNGNIGLLTHIYSGAGEMVADLLVAIV